MVGGGQKFYKINNDRFIDSAPAEPWTRSLFPTFLPMPARKENALGSLWEVWAFLNNTTAVSLRAYKQQRIFTCTRKVKPSTIFKKRREIPQFSQYSNHS